MYYVAHYANDPSAKDARQRLREAHVAFRAGLGERVLLAGPLLGTDPEIPFGSLLVFEAPDAEAAHAVAMADPYCGGGVLTLASLHPLRVMTLNPRAAL